MAHQLIRRALIAIVAIAMLALVLLGAAHLPFVRSRVFDWARAQAARDLGILIDADGVGYNLLTPSVALQNATLATGGEPPFLHADSVRLVLNRSALWGTIRLERVDLERPRVTIVRHPDGRTNLPISRSGNAASPAPLQLGHVDVRQLSVEIRDESAGRGFTAGPIDLAIDSNATNPATGGFGPSAFTLQLGAAGASTRRSLSGTVGGRLGFDGSRLSVPELRVETNEGRLALGGWLDVLAPAPAIDASGQLTVDLAQASRFVNMPDGSTLAGSARAAFEITGSMVDPVVRIDAAGQDLAYGSIAGTRASARATYVAGRLTIGAIDLASPLGNAAMDGELTLPVGAGSPGQNRVVARLSNVHLDPLLQTLGVTTPVVIGSTASGDVTLTMSGADPFGPGWLQRLSADGSGRMTPAGSGLAITGTIGMHLAGGNWTLTHELRSATAGSSATGVVSGTMLRTASDRIDSTLSGTSRMRIDQLGAVMPLLRQAGVQLPAPFDDRIGGSIDASIEPGGTLAAPRLLATISGRALRLAGYPAGELDATVILDRQLLQAKSFEARLQGASLAASGSYTWAGQADTRFAITTNDLETLTRAFELTRPALTGSARLEGALQGDVRSPRSQGTLTAQHLSVDGTPIGELSAKLDLTGWRLTVNARAPDVNMQLDGDVDTREPFAYRVAATMERTSIPALFPASLKSTLPIADGLVTATVQARGELRRPLESAGELALRSLDLVSSGIPIRLEAPATLTVGPELLRASPIQLRVGKETQLRLEGTLARVNPLDGLQLHLDGTLSELLEIAAPYLPATVIDAQDSRLTLDLHMAGTLRAPEPAGTMTLRAGTLRYGTLPPLTDMALDARIEPARIALQSLSATWQQARLTAEGHLPIRMVVPQPAPASGGSFGPWRSAWLSSLPADPASSMLTARVTNITPEVLAPFLTPSQLQQIAGTMAASVTADADAFAIDRIRASVDLDETSLALAGVPFTPSAPTRVRLEDGTARIESMRWSAQGNEVAVSGGVNLSGPAPTLDLAVEGDVDLRILGAFASGVGSGGLAHTSLTITGPAASPEILGSIGVSAGELRVADLPLAASDVNGRVSIAAGGLATLSLEGLVNGGTATIAGDISLKAPGEPHGRARLTARNVMLDYPDGFQTESNADLTLTFGGVSSVLGGRVEILNGTYREPLVLSRGLLGGLTRGEVVTAAGPSPFMTNLRLDVRVTSAEEIRIDNNYGRLDLAANLRITGTAVRPGAIGRIEAMPDGRIYLAGNTYQVQTLVVDLMNPRAIAPDLTFLAETRVGNVPIEVALQCSAAGPCQRDVRSQATGVTNQQAEAMLFGISSDPAEAGAQLARLLSGEVLGIVGRTVGLDTLRLDLGTGERSELFDDPTLVAGDVNPTSRLTVGKHIGEHVELAYSQDLAENGFTTSTSYFAPAGISFRALLLDDQSRSYEFRHEPRFGRQRRPRPPSPPRPSISAVRIGGTPGFSEQELRERLRLTEGDRFDFTSWQEDRARLGAFYQSQGFFEARIRARRLPGPSGDPAPGSAEPGDETTLLEYTIERGRATALEISGVELPDSVRKHIVERWTGATFDGFLERDVTLIVREHLYREGRLEAEVVSTMRADAAANRKTLRVDVAAGPALTPRLQFEGNSHIASARLLEAAASAGPLTPWLDPALFKVAIGRLYQEEGLLSAEVDVLEPERAGTDSIVRVVVHEGEPWRIGRVTLGGAELLADSESPGSVELPSGSRYDARIVAAHVASIEQRFRAAGYLDVRVVTETVLTQAGHTVDVHALAAPGPRSVLSSVLVEGASPESALVTRSVKLAVGEPVSFDALGNTRRLLNETGVFRLVDISLEPASVTTGAPNSPGDADRQVVAHVRLEERPRYSFRYGFQFNDEVGADQRAQRFGFSADLENRNIFGRGATVGLSARLRRDQQIGRLFVAANRFFSLPLRSTVFVSRSRLQIGSDNASRTVSSVTEVSAEQVYRLRNFIDLRYGYGMGQNRTTISGADFDLAVKLARLTTSGIVDRRSDPFNPQRGWFAAASMELSRQGLGSDLNFLKSFLQYFRFTPLGGQLLLASAARVGLARTFRGEDLIPSERFFGGGATSVRGYRQDDLGPRSIFDDAKGGRAMFIGNGELRFPIYRWLHGVGFVDVGDVYETVGDLGLASLQIGTGAGIRLDTPVGLLRLDIAAAVNRRAFDPKAVVYFGLGHAF